MIGARFWKGHFTMEWLFCWLWCGVSSFEKTLYQSGRPDLNRRPLDPQDMAVGIQPGQCRLREDALGAATCGLSGWMHSVWSQSGPKLGWRQDGGSRTS